MADAGDDCRRHSLFVAGTPVLDRIELNWLDLRFRTRGPIAPKPTVVLAAIDEKSVEAEGRWPWPRSRIAALIDALSRDGARVIAFDVTFAEPDENSRLKLVDQLARKVDSLHVQIPQLADFIRESRIDADNDRTLVRALERSKAAIVLGYFFHMSAAEVGYKLNEAGMERQLRGIVDSKYPLVSYTTQSATSVPLMKADSPQGNLEIFTAAAASSGYFTVATDPDGVVRWMPLVIQDGEDLFPPLSLLVGTIWAFSSPRAGGGVEGFRSRSLRPHRRGRRDADQLPAAEDLPPLLRGDILAAGPSGTFMDRIVR
jgi:adenylate cyclase